MGGAPNLCGGEEHRTEDRRFLAFEFGLRDKVLIPLCTFYLILNSISKIHHMNQLGFRM